MSEREFCTYTIEPRVKVRGKPWWRRKCKRLAEEDSDRCWQHRRPPGEVRCVPIQCEPTKVINLSGLVVMDVETFYHEHPEGVFGDPDE